MALAVASQGPTILILASRTERKIDEVAYKINQTYPAVPVKRVIVDFASQDSIRAAAAHINVSISKLDTLINNAGLMTPNRGWTREHLELQFGVNHIGPFLFTNLLLDKMLQAASEAPPGSTRIINVTSQGHRLSPIRFHDYNFEGKEIPKDEEPPASIRPQMLEGKDGYPGFLAYGQSKTANILFSVRLTQILRSRGIISFSLHPGSRFTLSTPSFP
jgi:NAD(P)-dependent dehydrogenase (short-subunit alcohol dehydrogenase family)